MDNLLSQLNDEGVERSEDRTGGGFRRLESDIYPSTIKTAFVGESSGGAMYVTFIFDVDNTEYRETLYISNKNKEVYYRTSTDKKAPIPGFAIFKNIAIICANKEPNQLTTEEKVIKVWDYETSQDQMKSVPVITDLTGKEVALGIVKELVNKRKKNNAGEYVETADFTETNRITAVFHPTKKLTVNEALDGKPAKFWDQWLAANQGKTKDRRKVKEGDTSFSGSTGSSDSGAKKNYTSVFD